ncbi:MAG: VWA domain-containing protein [candidate division Zixibacteria bacterium]|nr:VWA domain-containing protein [candidate division Zixibacteria bacterium]
MFQFASPYMLLLLVLLPLLGYRTWRKRQQAAIKFSDITLLEGVRRSARIRQRRILPLLRLLALTLLIVALARPQAGKVTTEVTAEGIDIMLALDISSSMKAEDFKPRNRLYVSKEVIKDFVDGRLNDRIGLVVFSKQSFTQCPLTLDYGVLLSFLEQVDFGMIEDGTAIGMAIANSVNRLRDSKAKTHIIVLLTDGINNAGEIDPLTAAEIAKTMGVKIYTIGAGKPGKAPYPVDDPIFGRRYVYLEQELDEETLTRVAEVTGGRYFRARSEEMLKTIYEEISDLEKAKIKVKEYLQYREFFPYLLLAAGLLLFLESSLRETRFRQLP